MTELATPPVEERTGITRISHWIGGRSVAGGSGRSGVVFNPATGRQTGAVDFATAEEVDQAVQAAKQAAPAWRAFSLAKRAELFFNIRELVHERRDEVGARVCGLGDEPEAVGREARPELEPDQSDRDQHGDECRPPLRCHRRSVFRRPAGCTKGCRAELARARSPRRAP